MYVSLRRPTDEVFLPSPVLAYWALPMIQFYTRQFFEELARQLSSDREWGARVKGRDVRIVCTAVDKKRSFLLDVRAGSVTAEDATPDTPADFRFEGHYDDWVKLCKGEIEVDKLVQTGRLRIAGSLPDAMGMMGPLNYMVIVARRFPKEF